MGSLRFIRLAQPLSTEKVKSVWLAKTAASSEDPRGVLLARTRHEHCERFLVELPSARRLMHLQQRPRSDRSADGEAVGHRRTMHDASERAARTAELDVHFSSRNTAMARTLAHCAASFRMCCCVAKSMPTQNE
jgi:hypothetical protein